MIWHRKQVNKRVPYCHMEPKNQNLKTKDKKGGIYGKDFLKECWTRQGKTIKNT